jgi:hypothetical protein
MDTPSKQISMKWEPQTRKFDVGFEVLTAVTVKSTVFWFVTPCSSWVSQARNWKMVEPMHSSEMYMSFYQTTDVTTKKIVLLQEVQLLTFSW